MRIAIASAFRHGAARRAPLLQHAAVGVTQQRSMHLTPRELDHLRLAQAGQVAQRRLARGLRLNHPEAVALISSQVRARAPPPQLPRAHRCPPPVSLTPDTPLGPRARARLS